MKNIEIILNLLLEYHKHIIYDFCKVYRKAASETLLLSSDLLFLMSTNQYLVVMVRTLLLLGFHNERTSENSQ